MLCCRNLCDIKQEGKLNPEQFALAMWLIAKKQSGKDPPAALTPDMVPPSMRPKVQNDVSYSSSFVLLSVIYFQLYFQGMSSIYNNPELEMMAKEIQAMLVEKLQIEKECQESYTNILILSNVVV